MIKLLSIFLVIGVIVFLLTFKLSMKIRVIVSLLSFLVPAILLVTVFYNAEDKATPGAITITDEMLQKSNGDNQTEK